jgi:uncharacterized repeat protein (TIGR01451 family)
MTFFSADNGGTYDTPNAGKVTWSLGDQLAGASGTVSFVATVGAGAGGTAQPAPTHSTENGTGSVTVTSSTSALTLPWCTETTCAAFRDKFQDTNGEPQSGWNDNPRLTTFNDTGWTQPAASSTSEYSYWTDPDNLSAQWVAPNQNGYTYGNFTFFRQAFCLPLNATGLDATLELAGDDTSDIYLNDVYVGQEYGAGGASSFDAAAGVQSGINLLAVQLLNNRHGGHDLPGCPGCDHIGLLFNLNASYGGLRPFAAAPSTALAGQSVQFAVDTLALGGGEPYQYKFDFGDGTVIDYQSSATYSHTYSTFGVKSAIVTARDAYGCTATDTVQVTVLSSSGKMLANSVAATYTDANGKSFTGASGSASGAGTLLIDDLSIVKTVQSGGTVPGENVTYQLVVTNNGQTIVTGAVVADTVPAAVTNVTWSCVSSDGSCTTPGSGNSLSGTTTLPSGATATYTIVGTISPAATGTLANTATVTAPEGITEQDLSNNTSTASSTLVPVAANDGTYTVPYFTAYTGNVLTNDVGSLLTVSSVTGSGSPCTTFVCTVSTAHGTVYVQADGTFRYEPNRYYSGTDSFTYVAKDSYDQSTSPTTVSFNVQNPAAPVATNDSGMTETNTALSQATSILTNDTGSGITLYSVTGTGAACTGFPCSSTTAHGSAVVQSDGTYIYTPATDYKGLDSFTYVIRDDLLQSASATVNLSVTPMANNDTGMTPTNTSLDSSSPGSTQSVNNAQIVYNDIGTAIVLYSVTGAGAPCITFPCTITTAHGGAVVQSDGAYVYTPAASYTGADSFSYVIHDEFGQSSSATVSFDVQNNPLAVELASFTATLTPGGVILAWETVSEQDNAGFNLYRAASAAGPWAPLNAALIPSAAPGSGEGHSYTWLDATAGPSSPCVYRLDALDRFGVTTQLGVTTACIPPRHTWLPLITR